MQEFQHQWIVKQEMYQPEREDFYESIFSLGNGYMGIRGFLEEQPEIEPSQTCTYIAGIYDYLKSEITDMVNTPNFSSSRIALNGEQFNYMAGKIIEFTRYLNLKEGSLTKSFIWEDKNGSKTKIETIRFLSIDNRHIGAMRYKVVPLNYSGTLTFEAAIDANVVNNPISDDQLKKNTEYVDFLQELERGMAEGGANFTLLKTAGTEYRICEALSFNCFSADPAEKFEKDSVSRQRYVAEKIEINMQQGKTYTLDKLVAVVTSRDGLETDIREAALNYVTDAGKSGFDVLYENNRKAWEKKWDIADIVIEGDEKTQLAIRFNIFQLIQGNAEDDPNISIGARSIFHGRYKGCYFWDTEIFMFPFYVYTNPKAARNLLLYRYHTLWGAEENARRLSVEGAKFAWMCTTNGLEQCETWDTGCCEIHINADVAYAIDQYCKVSGDVEFIRDHGTEIYIKTARYWKSRFTYNAEKNRYNMLFVKGPNEYGGVTENNTYTTIMAINNLKLAMDAVEMMKNQFTPEWDELKEKTGFEDSEMKVWKDIAQNAIVNYDPHRNLYLEDDNFLKLEPLNIGEFKTDDTPLYHKLSFDRLQRYMVLKQADVILLMTLLPQLFTEEEKKAAWEFYEPITLHDSTLSFGTHALFAARLGLKEKAVEYFYKSLRLDLDDVMWNTGKEGLHFASFGATWQAVVNGFAGLELGENGLNFSPNLPEAWKSLSFKLIYRGKLINVRVSEGNATVTTDTEFNF